MGKAEKAVEARLCSGIRQLGGRAYKFVSPGWAGVPDRVVCLPNGLTWFVELKTADGKLSAVQWCRIAELKKLKQSVWVLYGKDDVDMFLKKAKELLDYAV